MSAGEKRALIDELLVALRAEIATMTRAAKDAREAATHEEARPENDKDTRAIEAAYLAGAQADRVRELERVAKVLERLDLVAFKPGAAISASAVIELDCDGARSRYFMSPEGGGMRAALEKSEIVVVTPRSPLGQALLGKSVGDVIEVPAKGGPREYEIVDVS